MIYLIVGIFFLIAAVVLIVLALDGQSPNWKKAKAPSRPASNAVVFFNRLVTVMVGGKSFGTMTQMSLPGDEPEVWQIDLCAPNSSASDRHIVRQHIGSRAEAEEWVSEQVKILALNYEATFVHESSTVGA